MREICWDANFYYGEGLTYEYQIRTLLDDCNQRQYEFINIHELSLRNSGGSQRTFLERSLYKDPHYIVGNNLLIDSCFYSYNKILFYLILVVFTRNQHVSCTLEYYETELIIETSM